MVSNKGVMVVTNSMLRFTKLRSNRDRAPGNDPRGKNNSTRHDFAKHAACTRCPIKEIRNELHKLLLIKKKEKSKISKMSFDTAVKLNKSCKFNALYDNQ